MAKKKGGQDASKKTQQKKKAQTVEDKTFGLKNKNKSKKVQQQIKSIEKSVFNSGDPKQRKLEEQRKKAKMDAKMRRKAAKEEQDALFGEALMAVSKKNTTSQKAGKSEAVGRDGNDENDKKSTSHAMKMMYQMDAQEMDDRLREDPNYVPTLEDEIEMKRQQKVKEMMEKDGKKGGTPVTPETFAAWQERRRKKRAAAAKKLVEAELKKKKGGKGLSVLSGRDLYEYKKDLFDRADQDGDGNVSGDDETEDDHVLSSKNGNAAPQSSTDMNGTTSVDEVAGKVKTELFLEGDDEDLDDLDDD